VETYQQVQIPGGEEQRDILSVDPSKIRLFRDGKGILRLTIEGDRSYLTVRVSRAFPLSCSGGYIGFSDGKGRQIAVVDDLSVLDPESRRLVEEELRKRYFVARIERVDGVKEMFGVVQWKVQTDRGPREFLVRGMRESVFDLENDRVLIVDVDGNRYELPGLHELDSKSRALVEKVM
jgi:hypothetical protein